MQQVRFWCVSYTGGFPLVAGLVSQAKLVLGGRVIQTDEGTGRLAEVPGNHQGAPCSAGGCVGQLAGEGDRRFQQSLSHITY